MAKLASPKPIWSNMVVVALIGDHSDHGIHLGVIFFLMTQSGLEFEQFRGQGHTSFARMLPDRAQFLAVERTHALGKAGP